MSEDTAALCFEDNSFFLEEILNINNPPIYDI